MADMERIKWEDTPSTNTPLSAENLNKMQDNIENFIKGTVLYNNSTGTAFGMFELDQFATGFKRLKFYGRSPEDETVTEDFLGECYVVENLDAHLSLIREGSTSTYIFLATVKIVDGDLMITKTKRVFFLDNQNWTVDDEQMLITKIIAYKY